MSPFRICLQISNGSYSSVREILEDNHYILDDAKVNAKGLHGDISLGIDEYMEAVELYTFGVLAKDTKDMGLAVSWVEKAALPEETRQVLLNRSMSFVYELVSESVPLKSLFFFPGTFEKTAFFTFSQISKRSRGYFF